MAWIESHQGLRAHPKTLKLKRLLGRSLPATLGYLHLFWWWATDYAQDGDLSRYTAEDLDDAVGWDGDPGSFEECLVAAGFIDADRKIHDWDDYAGKLIERRRLDADRKRAGRPVDIQRTSEGTPDDGVRNIIIHKPNSTEPNQGKPSKRKRRTANPGDGLTEIKALVVNEEHIGTLMVEAGRAHPRASPSLKQVMLDLGNCPLWVEKNGTLNAKLTVRQWVIRYYERQEKADETNRIGNSRGGRSGPRGFVGPEGPNLDEYRALVKRV